MELELKILLWLVITAVTGALGGLSWIVFRFVLKRVLSGEKQQGGLHGSSLPPNGKRQDDEAWLSDLRQRVSQLEVKRETQERSLASHGRMLEAHEQELGEQNKKMQGLRDMLRRHKKLPDE